MQPQDVTRVLKTAVGANRDLRAQGFRRFTAQIAEPMDEAALSQRPGKTGLNGADQSGGAVSNDQERISQAAALEILEEPRTADRVLFRHRGEMQQNLLALLRDAPGAEKASRRNPTCRRSATPSTKR